MFSRPYSIFLLIFVVSRSLMTTQPIAPDPGSVTQEKSGGISVNSPRTYGNLGETPWFSNGQIRRDLGLSDDQYGRLETQYRDVYGRYQQNLNDLTKENLAPRQLEARRRELSYRMNEDFIASARDDFPDDAARDRYQQLYFQYRGYGSLGDPQVQQRINLTTEQRQRLDRLEKTWNQRMSRLNQDYGSDPDRSGKEYQELLRNHRKQMAEVLSGQQRTEWQTMIGEPYDFPAEVYFSAPERAAPPRTEPTPEPDNSNKK